VYTQTVDGGVTAELAQTALVTLSEAFGPYPWPDLVLAEVGAGGGFSMEYPRAIHLTRGKVTDPYVVYHEVAHQWFYAQIGNDQMLEPWLDEGFSDFSARYLMGIGEDQCSTRPVDSSVFAWQAGAISGGDWTSCDGYFHTVFYKGTEFLNGLRAAMGDDAFFAALRGFVEANRYGIVSARDLLGHLSRETDAKLRPIYRAYLAGPLGRPAGRGSADSP
jgi:aminopeptidase N